MKNTTLMAVVLVIMIGAGSFLAGMKYQQSKRPSWTGMQPADMHTGMAGQRGTTGRSGTGLVNGEIISADETSITVKQADDSTKIILLSESTAINKAMEGETSDLKTGERVVVFGQENPDGSISAANIQLNPQFREGFDRMHEAN